MDGVDCEICGSYRRGKPSCGDIDILISDRQCRDINLRDIVDSLAADGIITVKFNDMGSFGRTPAPEPGAPSKKFMGLAKMKGGKVRSTCGVLRTCNRGGPVIRARCSA